MSLKLLKDCQQAMPWFLCHELQTYKYYKCTYPEDKGNCGNCWTETCEEPSDKSALDSEIYKTKMCLNSKLISACEVRQMSHFQTVTLYQAMLLHTLYAN